MNNELDLYRQAIIDNFSVINIGDTELSFQKDICEYDNLNKNLTFRFDDSSNLKNINLYIVVTFNFRFAETIERFIKKLKEAIGKAKNNQLKQNCVYVVPIVTDTDADNSLFNSFKEKFKDEEVSRLP